MEQPSHSELLRLNSDLERVRQEHRRKKKALLAETRAKEDEIQDWLDDQQALIEGRRANLLLQLASASHRPSSSATARHELEPVTSSSPVDTMHNPPRVPQQLLPQQSASLAVQDKPCSGLSRGHSSHSYSDSDPAPVQHAGELRLEPNADQQILSNTQQQGVVPASVPNAEGVIDAELPNDTPLTAEPEDAESQVEIDISHVIPMGEQRDPGTTTFMCCRPRRRTGQSA
ncbi:hypothetical protein MMC14_009879 [Varicellaria rhodocarpa]|nr:hypothetical protein [Varicellaria rhodocarpa]